MEKDKDIIEIIVDDDTENIKENPTPDNVKSGFFYNAKNFMKDIPPSFVKISCAAASVIVLVSIILGIAVPKSDNTLSKHLASLHQRNSAYLAAKETNDNALLEKESALSRLDDKQKELEEFHNSQDNLDKVTEINKAMQEEINSLKSEITKKENTLTDLESSIVSQKQKTLTLSAGKYTVGSDGSKDIAAGKYNITGSGSISIGQGGKAVANKTLSSSGEVFTLNDGDSVLINGKAKLIPQ